MSRVGAAPGGHSRSSCARGQALICGNTFQFLPCRRNALIRYDNKSGISELYVQRRKRIDKGRTLCVGIMQSCTPIRRR
jgi:hypothetical protein